MRSRKPSTAKQRKNVGQTPPPQPDRGWVPSEEIVERLLGEATGPLRLLLDLVSSAALRRTEVLNIRWKDIDLKTSTIFIRGEPSRSGPRRVPLPPRVIDTMRIMMTQADLGSLVFANKRGGSITPEQLTRAVRGHRNRVARLYPAIASDVARVRLADLRRYAVQRWHDMNVEMAELMRRASLDPHAVLARVGVRLKFWGLNKPDPGPHRRRQEE